MLSSRQRKKARRIILSAFIIITIIIAGVFFYQWSIYKKAKFTHYAEFGIAIPGRYAVHGIDVSRYQETIAWGEVKAMDVSEIRLQFAFIKATEGVSKTDPKFTVNWKKSKQAGLYRGAYHFFIGSRSGKQQAAHFINNVKLESGDLPPVLDIEQLNSATPESLRKEAMLWLQTVESHYGTKPIIYTNVDFYSRYLGSDFDEYPLWVAHYYQPKEPRIQRGWHFWQHSDKGRVNGIRSKVDFNVFRGDSAAFAEILLR